MAAPTLAPAEDGEGPRCHNCGAPAPGRYCSECGQSTDVHLPHLLEFLHEFIGHHVALDGHLVASLRRLVLTPGGLTLDFFAGKRARYIAPLRLFLTLNVIFFLVISLLHSFFPEAGAPDPAESKVKTAERQEALRTAAREIATDSTIPDQQRRIIIQALPTSSGASDSANADDTRGDINIPSGIYMSKFLKKITPDTITTHFPRVTRRIDEIETLTGSQLYDRIATNILHYAPYTLLCLMPVCAFLMQLSFIGSRRGYVENLVSALHGHTFLFCYFLLSLLPVPGLVSTLLFFAALLHMVVALKRIYPVSAASLVFRLPFLAGTYFVAVMLATLLAILISILT